LSLSLATCLTAATLAFALLRDVGVPLVERVAPHATILPEVGAAMLDDRESFEVSGVDAALVLADVMDLGVDGDAPDQQFVADPMRPTVLPVNAYDPVAVHVYVPEPLPASVLGDDVAHTRTLPPGMET
jgi:hypothetical protein